MAATSGKRRPGPVRQLSLQSPRHGPTRGVLRKQLSVDSERNVSPIIGCWPDRQADTSSLKILANSIVHDRPAGRTHMTAYHGRPKPVKVAWGDRRQQSQENVSNNGVEIVARKCTGQQRPATAKPYKSQFPAIGDKESLLYSRQELAERLRKVWREREQSRNNLDIFLAHNSVESVGFEDEVLEAETAGKEAEKTEVVAVEKKMVFTEQMIMVTSTSSGSSSSFSSFGVIYTTTDRPTSSTTSVTDTKSSDQVNNNTLNSEVDVRNIEKPTTSIKPIVIGKTPTKCVSPFFDDKNLQHKTNVNFVNSIFPLSNANGKKVTDSTEGITSASNISQDEFKPSSFISSPRNEDTFKQNKKEEHLSADKSIANAPNTLSLNLSQLQTVNADSSPEKCSSEQSNNSVAVKTKEESNHESKATPSQETLSIINATTRRLNFRNNMNKAITTSFSSDISPIKTKESPPRVTPPLCRTLSAPAHKSLSNTRGILIKRPPLQGSMSVDYDEGEEDTAILPSERQIKSAPPRRQKLKVLRRRGKLRGEDSSDEEDQEKEKTQEKVGVKQGRKASGRRAEIVTMVSLMSSSGSDEEEDVEDDSFPATPIDRIAPWFVEKEEVPVKGSTPVEVKEQVKPLVVCLRKAPKSVSFQHQPSVSSSRYTSCYPSRRGSSALSDVALNAVSPSVNPPVVQPPLDTLAAKRKLLRTKSAPVQDSTVAEVGEVKPQVQEPHVPTLSPTAPESSDVTTIKVTESHIHRSNVEVKLTRPEGNAEDDTEPEDSNIEPIFQTVKEKECWQLFKKMSEKGVTVSYETILRGMLTPTEYRLRKKATLAK